VINAIDGKKSTRDELLKIIKDSKPGTKLSLAISRGGKSISATLVVGKWTNELKLINARRELARVRLTEKGLAAYLKTVRGFEKEYAEELRLEQSRTNPDPGTVSRLALYKAEWSMKAIVTDHQIQDVQKAIAYWVRQIADLQKE
jgi:hypothetical protein